MDIEKLQERDEEFIERTRSMLDGSSLAEFMQGNDVKNLYEYIYAESGFGDLIANSEPTYYRKDSALASGYAAASTDPVIVYLPSGIESERELIDYTGMNKQYFFSQVAANQIIPIRAAADEYKENDFYQSFFEDWRHHEELSGRYPIFANPVEETLNKDVSSEKYWKSTAKDFATDYELAGETVHPTPELSEKPAPKYFAERLELLKAVNQKSLINLIEGLLQEYAESLSSTNKDSERILDHASKAAFYGFMLYSTPTFRSMGSAVTISPTDYATAVEWLNKFVRKRLERGELTDPLISNLMEISAPVSGQLLDIEYDEQPRLTLPERGRLDHSDFEDINTNETLYQTLKDATEIRHRHMDAMKDALTDGSISRMRESYDDLISARENVNAELTEKVSPATKWLQTPISHATNVASHLPPTPLDGGLADKVETLMTSESTYRFFDIIIDTYRGEKMKRFVSERPTMQIEARVWESSYQWADKPKII